MADPVEVLDYWIGALGPEGWYAGGAAIDAECRLRFLDLRLRELDAELDSHQSKDWEELAQRK